MIKDVAQTEKGFLTMESPRKTKRREESSSLVADYNHAVRVDAPAQLFSTDITARARTSRRRQQRGRSLDDLDVPDPKKCAETKLAEVFVEFARQECRGKVADSSAKRNGETTTGTTATLTDTSSSPRRSGDKLTAKVIASEFSTTIRPWASSYKRQRSDPNADKKKWTVTKSSDSTSKDIDSNQATRESGSQRESPPRRDADDSKTLSKSSPSAKHRGAQPIPIPSPPASSADELHGRSADRHERRSRGGLIGRLRLRAGRGKSEREDSGPRREGRELERGITTEDHRRDISGACACVEVAATATPQTEDVADDISNSRGTPFAGTPPSPELELSCADAFTSLLARAATEAASSSGEAFSFRSASFDEGAGEMLRRRFPKVSHAGVLCHCLRTVESGWEMCISYPG